MSIRLNNKSIIVTGAGSGLGKATSLRLGQEGARVFCVDINLDSATETCEEIISSGGTAIAHKADMCSEPDIIEMIRHATHEFITIDGLLANAGIAGTGAAHETSLADWNNLINVSLTGKWLCAKHLLPHMMANKSGSIIFQSSICALNGFPNLVAYSAAKGALAAITRQMATDYGAYNIRINAIAPGTIETELVRETYRQRLDNAKSDITVDESLSQTASRYPLGRLGNEMDVSNMSVFLFSEESNWMTGTIIPVDGGYTAK